MTGGVGMSFERTEQTVAAVRTASEHISAALDALNAELRVLAPRWSGHSADTYNQAAAHAAAALAAMTALLLDAEKAATASVARSRDAENRAAALWE